MAWFWWLLGLIVLVMWIAAIVNLIQRRHTISGGKLAAWLIIILVFPVLGTLIYFLVNGASAPGADRDVQTLG
jgi:hypothetical protein